MKTPYRCIFCGAASWRDPSDQEAPPAYCDESSHAPFDGEDYASYRDIEPQPQLWVCSEGVTSPASRAEQYLAERNAARLEAQRELGETVRKLREERDAARAELERVREVRSGGIVVDPAKVAEALNEVGSEVLRRSWVAASSVAIGELDGVVYVVQALREDEAEDRGCEDVPARFAGAISALAAKEGE